MKSTVMAAACTLFVAAVLIGATTGADVFNYKCYKCNSQANPLECAETFGATTTQTEGNCTCCKKDKTSDLWSRSCGSGLDCFPTANSWVCYGHLCNAASPIKVQTILVAIMSGLGLATYLRFQ